ncbi:MAG: patatin-like phospholipase family protein [Weeksellaceae bacterium]
MRALVISGGGSKGAFAGGVAQFLIDEMKNEYDIFVGTSTGSLLISHLALNEVSKIREVFTSVGPRDIFNNYPFTVTKDKMGEKHIGINHFRIIKNFLKGKTTFGESLNLRKLIRNSLTHEEFEKLKNSGKDVVVTVSNLSLDQVEYKSIRDFGYDDFCDWIWTSANFAPFMSLVKKDGCEYADGGFASMVPIEEAINRGATIIDAIVLETEVTYFNRMPSRNVFSLLTNIHSYMADRIERQNIRIGKLVAGNKGAIINFYYTPSVLTTNSLVFDSELMFGWWERGLNFAREKNANSNEIKPFE